MKEKEITPFNRLLSMLKPDRGEIRNVYVFAAFSGIVGLGLPIGIQAIVNFIQMGRISTSWIILVILVVLAIVISGLLNVAQMKITENLQQRIFVRSALDFADRIPLMDAESIEKRYAPELPNRFFDTITIQKGISKLILDFAAASLQIIFGLILLSFYHSFFIFFGLALIILLTFVFKITATRGFESSLQESNYKYKIAHWLQQIAYARFSFKMAGTPSYLLQKTDRYLIEYLKSRNEHFKVLKKQYLYLIGFKALIALALLIIGGMLVINQTMNIGQFVAAEIIILLILSSVEKLIISLETVYDLLTAIEKIGQVTDIALERKEGMEIPDTADGYEIDLFDVHYAHESTSLPILNGVTLSIKPNTFNVFTTDNTVSTNIIFGIVGGINTMHQGNVSINNIPIGNLNRNRLRNSIGNMLAQDYLVNASILENITLGREYVSFSEVQTICEQLKLTETIQHLKEGYNTIITPEGHFLSKDSIRKILLARALVGSPKVLLLEEPLQDIKQEEKSLIITLITSLSKTTVIIQSEDKLIHEIAQFVFSIHQGKLIQ